MKMETKLIVHMFTYWCDSIRHLSFVSQAMAGQLGNKGLICRGVKGFCSYPKCPDQLLMPTLLSVKWVTGAVSLAVKRPQHEVTTCPSLVPALECMVLYFQGELLSSVISQDIFLYLITQNVIYL